MTVWDWLGTPPGIAATHAAIVLVLALAGWLNFQTHQKIDQVDSKVKALRVQMDGAFPPKDSLPKG